MAASNETEWQTRVRQVWEGLRPEPDPLEREFTRCYLTPQTQPLFDRLATHDRRHLVQVARQLAEREPCNRDLIVAGLLHDVGKADECGTVSLADRIGNVFTARYLPRCYSWLTRPGNSRWRHGMQLSANHAQLGAVLAEQHGCSERTIWLIKNHEMADTDDPDLLLLQDIDRITP